MVATKEGMEIAIAGLWDDCDAYRTEVNVLKQTLCNLVDDVVALKKRDDLRVGVDCCESWFSMIAARRLLKEFR